ncbi:hypothetical protein BS329_16075 [Amycolatopsis coloradensis]|uniref:Uncharacterized protein n=1 Tax=Amycolatopsis coloradensis TaxID=76021 RepID=A0A1R0KTE9_9PSEU|nr:hypothetical protein BS329_16075 [Amycolatopsis coloradensis]
MKYRRHIAGRAPWPEALATRAFLFGRRPRVCGGGPLSDQSAPRPGCENPKARFERHSLE